VLHSSSLVLGVVLIVLVGYKNVSEPLDELRVICIHYQLYQMNSITLFYVSPDRALFCLQAVRLSQWCCWMSSLLGC